MQKAATIYETFLPGEATPDELKRIYRDVSLLGRAVLLGDGSVATVFLRGGVGNELNSLARFAVERKCMWLGIDAPSIVSVDYIPLVVANEQMNIVDDTLES